MDEKKCTKCGEVKLFADFYKDKRWAKGFRSECKLCTKKNQLLSRSTEEAKSKRKLRDSSAEGKQRKAQHDKNYRLKYPEAYALKCSIKNRIKSKRKAALLEDGYVLSVLCARTNLMYKDIPAELLEAKRLQLQILRESKR